MANFFDAFPDAAYTLNDLFCAGDRGVWRGTWNATQRKEWEGISATGRKAKWTVIIIGRFEDEKLAEDWVEYDRVQSVSTARRALIRGLTIRQPRPSPCLRHVRFGSFADIKAAKREVRVVPGTDITDIMTSQ